MSLTTNVQDGKGGSPLPEDSVSSILFDSTVFPSGMTALDNIKQLNSISDAIALGIDGKSTDETKATGGKSFPSHSIQGDAIFISVTPANQDAIILCDFVLSGGDASSEIIEQINAGFNTHGYSALTDEEDSFSIIPPVGLGEALNSVTAIFTNGDDSETVTAFTGGVGSQLDILYYHIERFYANADNASLYIGIKDLTTFSATELTNIQAIAEGRIKWFGVFTKNDLADSQINLLSTEMESLFSDKRGGVSILTADLTSTTVAELSNRRLLNKAYVTPSISQDFGARGHELAGTISYSVGTLGADLARCAITTIGQEMAVKGTIGDQIDGEEFETIGYATGQTFNEINKTPAIVTRLKNYGYLQMHKITGVTGTFYDLGVNCRESISDFNRLRYDALNSIIARAIVVYFTNTINAKLSVQTAGVLSDSQQTILNAIGSTLINYLEISEYISVSSLNQCIVSQDITTVDGVSTVTFKVVVLPFGTAESLVFNISYSS